MVRAFLTKNPRDIFTAAEDFRRAASVLIEHEADSTAWMRIYGPYVMTEAFAAELYLKCILVDGGASKFSGGHNLLLLFGEIEKSDQKRIEASWEEVADKFKLPETEWPFDVAVASVALHFDRWRYRFEKKEEDLTGVNVLRWINLTLWQCITEKHPDWKDEGHDYFVSTFPAPISRGSNALPLSPQADSL